ncbi:MAG: hypothetical protein D6675_12185 [Gemmatimonadetes bacterium]|nr:MAG: hypothetical protein D6675_12185 [Gemmatimonadota bacterium]
MRYLWFTLLLFLPTGILWSAENYHWPLDINPPYLTSSFAEYRPRHFHAGLDFKTWNQEGFACYAIADGYISRLRAAATGYGKAVYLTTTDGHIAVYAHLQRFAGVIEERAKQEQQRLQRYRFDITLPPNAIPVQKGDIIAFSGSTGIGAPHLHFEFRKLNDNPLNPLLHGFAVPDSIAPNFLAISLTPVDETTTINGQNRPLILWGSDKIRTIPEICGKFFVGVRVTDQQSNAIHNRYGPYRIELFQENQSRFFIQFDEFSYDTTLQIESIIDFSLQRRGKGRYYRLFREYRCDVPVFGDQPYGHGILDTRKLGAGRHSFRIVASDASGNTATLDFKIDVSCPVDSNPVAPVANPPNARAGEAHTIFSANHTARLHLTEGSLYRDLAITSIEIPASSWSDTLPRGMQFASPILQWSPDDVPFREYVRLSFRYDPHLPVRQSGVYQWDGKQWRFENNILNVLEGTISASIYHLGTFAVIADTLPPQISHLSPPNGKTFRTPPSIRAVLTDNASGIFEDDIHIYLNGKKQISIYDPESHSVHVSLPPDLPPGRYDFQIQVTDRAGNRAEKSGYFQCH